MSFRIELLNADWEEAYGALVTRATGATLFHGAKYRRFLQRVLADSEDRYLLAIDGQDVVGALPAFLRRNERYGAVLNSLPFYGSHGGVLALPESSERVREGLLDAFYDLARTERVVASTIVSSPFVTLDDVYRARSPAFEDVRIGQLTPLPVVEDGATSEAIADALFRSFHPKTRNAVRKGLAAGLEIARDGSLEAMRALASLHAENVAALGGLAKPMSVFEAIRASFEHEVDYELYTARVDGDVVSALLVFFHGAICEYYTPAIAAAVRSSQAGAALVFEAMKDATRRNCSTWNWGGTWVSQEGVHRFKSRWGARDVPYRYFIHEAAGSELRSLTREAILREYPSYYVLPFTALRAPE